MGVPTFATEEAWPVSICGFEILSDCPAIANNQALVRNNRHAALIGLRQERDLSKAPRDGISFKTFVCQCESRSPTPRREPKVGVTSGEVVERNGHSTASRFEGSQPPSCRMAKAFTLLFLSHP